MYLLNMPAISLYRLSTPTQLSQVTVTWAAMRAFLVVSLAYRRKEWPLFISIALMPPSGQERQCQSTTEAFLKLAFLSTLAPGPKAKETVTWKISNRKAITYSSGIVLWATDAHSPSAATFLPSLKCISIESDSQHTATVAKKMFPWWKSF